MYVFLSNMAHVYEKESRLAMGLHYLLCFIHVLFSLTLTVHLKFLVSIEFKVFIW